LILEKKSEICRPIHIYTNTQIYQTMSVDIEALNQQIYQDSAFVERLNAETGKVIIGQHHMIERLMLGLLAKGHILLEGLPGLAKTLAIKTLASAVNADFKRIQFTPDLLPADIVGTMIYNQGKGDFTVRKGPIFSNFVLADEINRAPAKVQSALLEAMQERQVTIGGTTYPLQEPFLVLATQNPIEQEGTYPLPEAQTDRFMMKVKITYPTKEEEQQIMRLNMGDESFGKVSPVVTIQEILKARKSVQKVYMDEKIERYILDIVFATRQPQDYGLSDLMPLINYGGSPRASINLAKAAKAYAFLQRRGYVIPEDVRAVCEDIMCHRIGITYEAEAENVTQEDIIGQVLNTVEVP
jgi:MoxR-like ATPase